MHFKKNLVLVLTTSLLFLFGGILSAQDNTLYLMPEIPQANQLNPAYFKLCRVYVELPVISSVRVNFRNSGFSFHDAIEPGTSNPYVVDFARLETKLKDLNFAQSVTDVSLLGAGFAINDWYFTFGISNHTNGLITYPYDVLSLRDISIVRAGTGFDPLNLSRLSSEITVWNSIGVSMAKEISDGFKFGVRMKYLQGMANMITRNTESFLYQYANPRSLETSFTSSLSSSFPVTVATDPSGIVRNLNFDNSTGNILSDFIFNRNRGISFDAGFVYDPNDKTELSFSMTDLGFIKWKSNTHQFNTEGYVVFRDTTLTRFQNNPSEGDLFRALRDTVLHSTTAGTGSYITMTPLRFFGGITHEISSHLRAGAMTRIELYNLHFMPSLTLSLNYSPGKFLSTSLSYTLMNNKFNQIGAGIALGNRVVQFYLTADNIPVKYVNVPGSSLFWPNNARMFSMHTGINLIFGCRDKAKNPHQQKKRKDKDDCPAYN
jgi:hypothetical protein